MTALRFVEKLRDLVAGLVVYPENMERNMQLTKGLYHSQTILLELTRRGMERKTAYEAVQRAAMKTWRGDRPLSDNLRDEPEITTVLPASEIDQLCSLEPHLRYVDETFRRVGLL